MTVLIHTPIGSPPVLFLVRVWQWILSGIVSICKTIQNITKVNYGLSRCRFVDSLMLSKINITRWNCTKLAVSRSPGPYTLLRTIPEIDPDKFDWERPVPIACSAAVGGNGKLCRWHCSRHFTCTTQETKAQFRVHSAICMDIALPPSNRRISLRCGIMATLNKEWCCEKTDISPSDFFGDIDTKIWLKREAKDINYYSNWECVTEKEHTAVD